jgi:hypothetical protein
MARRVRQIRFEAKELCRTTVVATGLVRLARKRSMSTHGWVNCALKKSRVLRCMPNHWNRPMLTSTHDVGNIEVRSTRGTPLLIALFY